MSNPFDGIITPAMKTMFTNALDALHASDGGTVPCRLTFGDTSWDQCPNCEFDALRKRSKNEYNGTGPLPFTAGICPICHGEGRVENVTTETIYVIPIYKKSRFIGSVPVDVIENTVQTQSIIDTFTSIKQAKTMVLDTGMEGLTTNAYTRFNEPQLCGFGDSSYVLTLWTRSA